MRNRDSRSSSFPAPVMRPDARCPSDGRFLSCRFERWQAPLRRWVASSKLERSTMPCYADLLEGAHANWRYTKPGSAMAAKTTVLPSSGSCPRCGTAYSGSLRYCPTCKNDLGAPNVREHGSPESQAALNDRATQVKKLARRSKKCWQELQNLSDAIERRSGVVVTMPASVARNLVSDPDTIYENMETLVGAGVRRPPTLQEDKHRAAVVGILFGTYGRQVVYGILSLTAEGLPTYGDMSCRLRTIAIQDRTTFLETNSYRFVAQHRLLPNTPVPRGYAAVWNDRHLLAICKLGKSLPFGTCVSDWQRLLVQTDGRDRSKDEFVEAHIYDSFDIAAVQEMLPVSKQLCKEARIDVKLALERFAARSSGQGKPI